MVESLGESHILASENRTDENDRKDRCNAGEDPPASARRNIFVDGAAGSPIGAGIEQRAQGKQIAASPIVGAPPLKAGGIALEASFCPPFLLKPDDEPRPMTDDD